MNVHNQNSLETTTLGDPSPVKALYPIRSPFQTGCWVREGSCGGGAEELWVQDCWGPVRFPDATSSVDLPGHPVASLLPAYAFRPA